MTTEISFYQTSIDSKNKSASTSFTSEEGISAISEKMQNLKTTENNNNIPTKLLMSASSSEMLDKSTELSSDQKVGAVSSSSFEESSSDNEDKKSTTSGASSDLSSKEENNRKEVVVQFGTQWMESSSNQTSSGNEEDESAIQFNPMVSRGGINRSDSAVSKSSGKSLDSTISKSSLPISEAGNHHHHNHAKIDSTTSPRDSIFSTNSSFVPDKQLQPQNKEQPLNEADLLLYNECYTQVLRQLRRRREDDMKRARRTLEESQWLLDLLWKATNVQKKFSRHNSITSELETVQEELEQARQVFLGRQKLKSVERKSSFSKPKTNAKPTKSVVFNRKIAVSQPSNSAVVPSNTNEKVKPSITASLRPPSFSTTSLDTKYKASGGLNTPKTERTALIGKIIETAVKIDEKEAKLNNTPRRLANNDRLIIKLKIMLSKKWSKDGEPITWTRLTDNSVYDV